MIPRAPKAVRRAAVRCYSGQTWKRRLIRAALGLAVRSGALAWFGDEHFPALGPLNSESFQNWAAAMGRTIGGPELHPVLAWPADPIRRRVYVHFLDGQARPVAFAKLALDRQNSERVENECRTLQGLRAMNLEKTRVPAVLATGDLAGSTYVVVESVPWNASSVDFEADPGLGENIREYAGRTKILTRDEFAALGWWQQFDNSPAVPSPFRDAAERAASDGAHVCRIHGDLNRTNVMRANGKAWLLDWERSSPQGPCLTDTICMDVDRRWRLTQRRPEVSLRTFLAAHWHDRPLEYRHQVILALAYLQAVEFTPAQALIRRWNVT